MRTLRLGGGLQIDALRTDVHLLAGWEDRNFLGGLRRFTVEFRPGVVLYPTRIPGFQAPTDLLPEEKLRVELRQPGFIEARTNGFIRSEFNIFPVLLSEEVDEDAPVIGYRELRGRRRCRSQVRSVFPQPEPERAVEHCRSRTSARTIRTSSRF